MNEIAQRFREAAEAAAKLIEEGHTDVSVSLEQHSSSTIIFNSISGDQYPDMLKKSSPVPVVSIKVKASKSF